MNVFSNIYRDSRTTTMTTELDGMTSLTIAHCLQQSSQLAALSDTPRLDVEIILAHILQKSRTYLFAWPEKNLSETQACAFETLFARRLTGEPIAHIVGVREFWSLELMVNNTTLIPRPDTELLVETALNIFADDAPQIQRKLLDLGTGTGAIALALAHEKTSWQCMGVDKEHDAVTLAEKNRLHLGLTNLSLQQSDWFSSLGDDMQFDMIVSNPPYIDPADPHLNEGDVRFEPLSALISSNNGLADLQYIIANAQSYLMTGGWLLVEHGYDQATAVRELFAENVYHDIKTLQDFGANDRVTMGKK